MQACRFTGCERPTKYIGFCNGHYQQQYHGKALSPLVFKPLRDTNYCHKEECLEKAYAHGLCRKHYRIDTKNRENELARLRYEKCRPSPRRIEQRRTDHARRKALLRGASTTDSFSKLQVWEEESGVCGLCFLPADEYDWHLDHIIPLSRGGQHTRDNVQVSHPFCNLSKGNLLPEEFNERTRMGRS